MRCALTVLMCAALVAACRPAADEEILDDTAARQAAATFRDNLPLTVKLEQLEAELARAVRTSPEEEGLLPGLLRAEAITDRLLESEPPFAWLAQGYDVEARLRQIQALADRIVAELRRGRDTEATRSDVLLLYRSVVELREALGRPGRDAPATLDSLMGLDSIRVVRSPAAP